MIFNNISNISAPSEKAFFIEKVQIYVRLVEEYCASQKLSIVEGTDVIDEFISMGVILNEGEVAVLRSTLGDFYTSFQSSLQCL